MNLQSQKSYTQGDASELETEVENQTIQKPGSHRSDHQNDLEIVYRQTDQKRSLR